MSDRFLKGKRNYSYFDLLFSRFAVQQGVLKGLETEGYWPCSKRIMDVLPIYLALIDGSDGGINLFYRYAIDRYNRQDMERLHQGMAHILEKGMADPSLTLKALMADFA